MENINGIVLSLSKEIIDFMFENKKDIFIKYTLRGYKYLEKEHKLYIYQSGSNRSIIGDATIKNIEYLNAKECLTKYEDRLIINREDLLKYSEGREHNKALILELTDMKRYEKEIKLSKPITMGGLYITSERMKEFLLKNRM